MKKTSIIIGLFVLFGSMLVFSRCTSVESKYLGRLPEINFEWQQRIDNASRRSFSEAQSLRTEAEAALSAEIERLAGTEIKCEGLNDEIFTVVDNKAVASAGEVSGGLVYKARIRLSNTLFTYFLNYTNRFGLICFAHFNNEKLEELRSARFVFGTPDYPNGPYSLALVKGAEYDIEIPADYAASTEIVRSDRDTIVRRITDEYKEYCRSFDRISISIFTTPCTYAIKVQEDFYKAIVNQDYETIYGLDYAMVEDMSFSNKKEENEFWHTYEYWKKDNPEKWKVIKDFRLKEIDANHVLSFPDVSDPKI